MKTCNATISIMAKRSVDGDDKRIGYKIRQARVEAGLTQINLAQYFGISGQQIQKFESGANRISAKMLYKLSKLCHKSVDWFLQDLESPVLLHEHTIALNPLVMHLVRDVRRISNVNDQKKVLKLLKVFADNL